MLWRWLESSLEFREGIVSGEVQGRGVHPRKYLCGTGAPWVATTAIFLGYADTAFTHRG